MPYVAMNEWLKCSGIILIDILLTSAVYAGKNFLKNYKMNQNCINCDKDFCECVKQSMAGAKLASRDYKVSATLKWLKKNKIYYGQTATPNVVKLGGRPMIFISLISETSDKRGDRKIKFRREGSTWQTMYSSEILPLLRC